MVIILNNFGQRLKKIRKKRGITLAKMADDLNTIDDFILNVLNYYNFDK